MAKKNIIIGMVLILIAIAAGAVILAGFNKKSEPSKTNKVQKEEIGVGIVTSDQKTIGKYQAFVDYLNKNSDDNWYLVPLKDYGSFISQMELKQIKAGFVGSYVGYRLIKEGLGSAVARGEKNGISTYNGYIFTRRDSGLNKLEDLKDKKFAYVDIYTSAGYVFPRYLLKSKGYDPENFFRVVSFLGSHDKAIFAVLNGEFNGGAAKDITWRKLAAENPDLEKDLQIIAQGGPFPEQTFMINAEFGQDEVNELRKLLIGMNNSEEGRDYLNKIGADRFIATEEKDFSVVKKISDFIAE